MKHPEKPLVIPIFIPHSGCPHQCAFCNQVIITEKGKTSRYSSQEPDETGDPVGCGSACDARPAEISQIGRGEDKLPSAAEIESEVERYLGYRGSRREVQLAFFGGNFLGLEKDQILTLLSHADKLAAEGKISSIRFSTRPDTITEESLALLDNYPVSTIELGVQSMDDSVLSAAKRGHTAADTVRAAGLLEKHFISKNLKESWREEEGRTSETRGMRAGLTRKIGMQMMVGLPGENLESAIDSAVKIADLRPDFVRIYPLVVLQGSLIAVWYRQGRYTPLDLDECVDRVKEIYRIFEKSGIPVIRMGLQASDLLQDQFSLLAGPWHPAFGHLVYSELFLDRAISLIENFISNSSEAYETDEIDKTEEDKVDKPELIILVHPASISRLKGDRCSNMIRLSERYPSFELNVRPDATLSKDEIRILHPDLTSCASGQGRQRTSS